MLKSKAFSILVSLVVAIGLWAYVVTVVTPEDSQWVNRIPVTFSNEDGLFSDRNLVLSSGRDATVDLRLYGRRQDLLKLNSGSITITADLSQVTGAGEWRLPYTVNFPENVTSNDISVEDRSTYYISVSVDKQETSEVEIRAIFQGDVAEGYTTEPIELEYDSLEISGPRESVTRVKYAQVILSRTNVSRTVSDNLSFSLMDENDEPVEDDDIRCTVDGVTVERIGVMMPVYMLKDVPLRVELIEGGGATEDHATTKIEPSSLQLKGDPELLSGLNSINLGTVDLASIQTSVTQEFTVVIPDGLTNMTGNTTAMVTVELKNLKTKTFRVTNIEYVNTPEGLAAKLGTISLEVQLRGPEETINALASSSIRAVADLSGIHAIGQFSVPATIYVDGATDVGATGTYNVLVTISEPTEETAMEVDAIETESIDNTTDDENSGNIFSLIFETSSDEISISYRSFICS